MSKKENNIGKNILLGTVIAAGIGAVIAYKKRDKIIGIAEEIIGKIESARNDIEVSIEETEQTPDMIIKESVSEEDFDNHIDSVVEDSED